MDELGSPEAADVRAFAPRPQAKPEGAPNQGFRYKSRLEGRDLGPQERLLAFLRRRWPAGREAWAGRLARGELWLEGTRCEQDLLLQPGQRLVWARPPWVEPKAPLTLPILYEDESLVAVNKPEGLPTLPGADYLEHTALTQLRRRFPEASPLHRLGRGTTGVLLFGRSRVARRKLQASWGTTRVRKIYLALVEGAPATTPTAVEAPIGKCPDPVLGYLHAACETGKVSRSVYQGLGHSPEGQAVVAVEIFSGRPHQIRIHMAFAGHPLIGDPVYGAGGRRQPGSQALPGDLGYRLHAWRLYLDHPGEGPRRSMCLEAPAPAWCETCTRKTKRIS